MSEPISSGAPLNEGNPEYELDIDFGDDEPDFQDSDYVLDNEESDIEVHYEDGDYGTDWIINRSTYGLHNNDSNPYQDK